MIFLVDQEHERALEEWRSAERRVEFALWWRDETPAPALQHFIQAAQDGVHTAHASVRPALAAVA